MSAEEIQFFSGELLFKEGEHGGGLYFIRSGEVEVFRTHAQQDVRLSLIKPGEVLGTLTFLDKTPRTASARAITNVTATYVSREDATHALDSVPNWINVIVHDAVGRLKLADQRFLNQKDQEDLLKEELPNIFDHAAQLAGLIAMGMALGTLDAGPNKLFPMANLWGYAEIVIGKRHDYLQSIFRCFVDANLVQTRTDGQWGLTISSPDPARLKAFATFARRTNQQISSPLAIDTVELWMTRLIRLGERNPDKKLWTLSELVAGLQSETEQKTASLDEVITLLVRFGIIDSRGEPHNESFIIDPAGIVRRLTFERVLTILRHAQISQINQQG